MAAQNQPSVETAEQTIARLQAENAALKAKQSAGPKLSLKVSEKGGVSLYGLGRFPVTLYGEQWRRLIAVAGDIEAFLNANAGVLKNGKDDERFPNAQTPAIANQPAAQFFAPATNGAVK